VPPPRPASQAIPAPARALPVVIDFDLVCPWCYIGLRHFQRARAGFRRERPGVDVVTAWQPLQLLPDVPANGLPYAPFYEQRLGSLEAVRVRRRQVTQAAEAAGLALDLTAIERMPNTARAHRLLQRVAELGDVALHEALLERLFAAWFQLGQDIGDAHTLHALALAMDVPEPVAAVRAGDALPLPAAAPVGGVPHYRLGGVLALSGARDAQVLLEAMRQASDLADLAPA
jgi:predicted DsbA family dithiol-disulfide isomerase